MKINKILIFIIIVIIMVFGIYLFQKKIQENNIITQKSNILNYLNTKYGNNEFNIIEIEKDYSYNGIIQKTHTGYEVTITSDALKNDFTMYIDDTNRLQMNDVSEDFVEKYYNENLNEYLSQKYDLNFDLWLKEENIPTDCGHIPTFNELVDFKAIDKIYINVYKNNNYVYDNDINGRINHLKRLSNDLINYLNISRNVTITFYRWANSNSFSYTIEISNNTIKITNDYNKETYEFNIDELG